jgi:CysZ protein
MKEFLAGITSYREAHRMIFKYRLQHYLFIPGLISVMYISLLLVLGFFYLGTLVDHIMLTWMPDYLQGSIMEIFLLILVWILLLLLLFITYRHVVLALLSPFLCTLSEKTECLLSGKSAAKFRWKQALSDLIRGIRINLRILILSLLFSLIVWIFVFIPVIGAFLSLAVSFIIQSYYGGFALLDYTLERRRFSVKESIAYVKQQRAAVTGIGTGFFVLSLIPLIGWFLAPAYGTIAATLMLREKR